MIRTRKLAVTAALLLGFTLTGCGNDPPVTYAPTAYGQNGHCFYILDPAEVAALQQAGLCPPNWLAYEAPLAWQESYYSYYSSPAYVNVYVPSTRRTVYVTHETTFHTTYVTQINTASKTATYKGSNGKTVTGPAVGTVKFGGGSGRQQQFGGGNGRTGTVGGPAGAPAPAPGAAPKPQASLGGGNGRAPAPPAPKPVPPKVIPR